MAKQSNPKKSEQDPKGSEIAADAARDDDKPKFAGEQWDVAQERGDQRFGVSRADNADNTEVEQQSADADTAVESGGEQAGMRRGEKPRKPAFRDKNRA